MDRYIFEHQNIKTLKQETNWDESWGYDLNYYAKIFNFASKRKIRLLGLNIPYPIAKYVGEIGLENVPPKLKKILPVVNLSNKKHRLQFEGFIYIFLWFFYFYVLNFSLAKWFTFITIKKFLYIIEAIGIVRNKYNEGETGTHNIKALDKMYQVWSVCGKIYTSMSLRWFFVKILPEKKSYLTHLKLKCGWYLIIYIILNIFYI